MKPDDYIHGHRHGREAHDLELDSMTDPLLADAIDGFDDVPGGPGQHAAALERLTEGIARSATGGRAAARARATRLRERRIRGWSVASAAVLLAAVAGGGTWLLRNGIRTDDSTLASRTPIGGYPGEVVEILPPVTVITDEEADAPAQADRAPAAGVTPLPPAAGMHNEIPIVAEVMAEVVAAPKVVAAPDAVAEPDAVSVQSRASRVAVSSELSAAAPAAAQAPARDTTQTDAFRRHVALRNSVRSAVMGSVTISFEVGTDGRPRNVEIVESPTPELGEFARTLLDEGPDWPAGPAQKLITINL